MCRADFGRDSIHCQGRDTRLIVRADFWLFLCRCQRGVANRLSRHRMRAVLVHFHNQTALLIQTDAVLARSRVIGKPEDGFCAPGDMHINQERLAGNELPGVELDL